MKTLITLPLLACVVVLAGGATAPDVVVPGYKPVGKDMRVDPGPLAKTHFLFTCPTGTVSEVEADTPIRAYLWRTHVYAVLKNEKAAVLERVKRAGAHHQRIQTALAGVARSEQLESRESVRTGDPTARIEVRYRVTGLKDGKVTMEKSRRLFDAKGKELKPGQIKKARRSYAALLGAVGAVGVVGLGLVVGRRSRRE